MKSRYRPDIDGLKAFAILLILLYNGNSKYLSGGYIGIDIFFVISGYLIASVIVKEIENGNFSIIIFYENRLRRILPALIVVMAASIAVGFILLNSIQYIDLGRSAIATSLFISNIYFIFDSGYFDHSSEGKPLLHTWSIAIGVQYYILLPILLMFITKRDGKKYAKWLIFLIIFSFGLSLITTKLSPSSSFYLLPTRIWELLLGSIIAILALPPIKQGIVRDLLSGVGIILIIFCAFYYTSGTVFPGFAVLIPTMGTALILFAGIGGDSFVGKLLSLRPIAFIGLVSYSLYLWHWPIIVYTKYYSIIAPDNIEIGLMLGCIFILSILSWHYIEKPIIKKKILARQTSFLITSSTASVIIIYLGVMVVHNDGFPNRYLSHDANWYNPNDSEFKHWAGCQNVVNRINGGQELCNIGENGTQSFILWGDSHARSLAPSINISAKSYRLTGKVATKDACPPLMSIERPNRFSCQEFNQTVLQYILEKPDIMTVILAARWALQSSGSRYKSEPGKPIKLIDIESPAGVGTNNNDLLEIGLRRTIDALQKAGKSVILVKPVPEVGFNVPSTHIIALLTGRNANSIIAPSLSEYLKRTENVTSIFLRLEEKHPIVIIDPSKYLCDAEICNVLSDGIPLYRDDDHLSTFGSRSISSLFDDVFSDMKRKIH